MIYLDTHAVVWLYSGMYKQFSPKGRKLMSNEDVLISPIVRLELSYLFNLKRIKYPARRIIQQLEHDVGLCVCDESFDEVMKIAEDNSWTTDLFDRIIVSQAALTESLLLTKDRHVRKHYQHAVW